MTHETTTLIAGAHAVLHLTALSAQLERLNPDRVRSLASIYESSDVAALVYADIADAIVEAAEVAKESNGYVCWITYGHPLFLVDSSYQAIRDAERKGLRVQTLPAVSSIDMLLIDSPTYLGHGGHMLEADAFVKDELVIDPRVPLVLFQAGDFGADRLRSGTLEDFERFRPLQERLASFYPPDHPLHIVLSAWREGMASKVVSTTLRNLEAHSDALHTGVTLVVPPVSGRK